MKAHLLFPVLAVLALGTAPAAAQGLLGNLTGGLIGLDAGRDDNHTSADVIVGGDNSRQLLVIDYGEFVGETGTATLGIPGFADLGSFIPGLPGLFPGGEGGGETPVPPPVIFPETGGSASGSVAATSQLAFLASLMTSQSCGIGSGSNVVVVDVSAWLAPREIAGLGSVIASHAGDIAACQATISRSAATLGLSASQLARVIAVDTRGDNVVLYMA